MSDAVEPAQPPPPSEAPAAGAPADGWDEDLYRATCSALIEPEVSASAWSGAGCLLLSLVLFALSFYSSTDAAKLAILIPVLLLHELGHAAGMRLFGYRNVQMFFVPFLGAAVSGRKHAAPVWQQVVVLLLGPLPGLLLALALQAVYAPDRDSLLGEVVLWLVALNGFNLLPIVPLDGGRIADVLFFARRAVLAVTFRLLAVAALVALGYWWSAWPFFLIALALAVTAAARYRKARLERAFSTNPLDLPDQLEAMSAEQRRDLFGWAMLLNPLDRTPVTLAADIRALHENMVSRRPGALSWSLMLLLYLAGFACAVGTIGLSREQHRGRRAALISAYEETVTEMAALRKQQVAGADPQRRLQGEIDQRWKALLQRWRAQPQRTQVEAWVELVALRPNQSWQESQWRDQLRRDLQLHQHGQDRKTRQDPP